MHKPQLVVCWGQNIVLIITSWPRERRKEIRKKRKAGKKEDREREKEEEGRKGERGRGRTEERRQGAHSMYLYTDVLQPTPPLMDRDPQG